MAIVEIYHLRTQTGKHFAAVFTNRFITPAANDYMQAYHAGLRKPHYSLPVPYDPERAIFFHSEDQMWLLAFDWIATYDTV